ncbi:MAG: hypothetical protein LBE82_03835 [Chitinophagaceae bacterium]|jgi:hypothetical protein|nr:hypothetical protein [Chitinophagaceae bacterium]
MKKYLIGIFYSLPVQLFLLHLRRYQVFLLLWYILFATTAGHFLSNYGAQSLFLSPEYLGKTNALSLFILGGAMGIFIMSWNITTFIIHSRQVRFLATTAQPFLKFFINNALIPLLFLIFYSYHFIQNNHRKELVPLFESYLMLASFLVGIFCTVAIGFTYFFRADKSIYKRIKLTINKANQKYDTAKRRKHHTFRESGDIRVDWFLTTHLGLRKSRDVNHYDQHFLDLIFKRHHFAGIIAIFLAFMFLVILGYLSDLPAFQVPAGASITVFFAIVIAVSGALFLFLHSWSIPFAIALYLVGNVLYKNNILELRSKAYGLNYNNKEIRPLYTKETLDSLASYPNRVSDKIAFIETLDKWKAKQASEKPALFIVNVSGGGLRSAIFTMKILQQLDYLTAGDFMKKTVLINGASGGMLGAAYFRALYWEKEKTHSIVLQDSSYLNDISKDLLNPIFSSFISRDILGPSHRFEYGGFEYNKGRAYSFEQRLTRNTHELLNKNILDYKYAEANAEIPMMFFNSTVTTDGRRMTISTRPARFMMCAATDSGGNAANIIDAIDFLSLFKNVNAANVSMLSALRMNATFPYVLPNVWLPAQPTIDVMDAGLRDNFGRQSSLRFINVFKDWLRENTSKVVMINIIDRPVDEWNLESKNLIDPLITPFSSVQNNWFKVQGYEQANEEKYLTESYGSNIYSITFQYIPTEEENKATLSFHISAQEKNDIIASTKNASNSKAYAEILDLIK